MNEYIKKSFLLLTLNLLILSCNNVKSNEYNEPEIKNSLIVNETPPPERKVSPVNSIANKISESNTNQVKISNESKICKSAEVPLSPGLPDNASMNEASPNDVSTEGLNNLLRNIVGDFAADTKQQTYFFEGDYNGDACQDIAIIVGATNSYQNIKDINQAASNTNFDVIKTNLRTGATLMPSDVRKQGAIFPRNLKSVSDRAFVIIHGGERGWNWKYGGQGRIYLLLDSVITEKDCAGCSSSLLSKTSNKNGSECFPKSAKGEGIFTGGEEGGKLIYFDGKQYKWTQCGD